MLETICIAQDDFLLDWTDFGRFAEALVFYQHVHILTNHNNFKSLVRVCGSDVILELSRMGNLRIHYSENMTGVGTRNPSPTTEKHGLVCVKAENQNFLNDATKFFEEHIGPSGKGLNKILREFSRLVEPFEYPKSLLEHVQSDITDHTYVRSCVRGILSSVAPEYPHPNPLVFDVFMEKEEDLRIESNIDFVQANVAYHKRVSPEHSSLSKAYILARILSARGTLEMASEFSSDLLFGPMGQVIAANKIATLLKERQKNQIIIDKFTDLMIKDSRAISEAVNSRQRNFNDVLKLVVQAQRFKAWLGKQDNSADMIAEYCREVSHLDWAEKLPSKTVRWLLINAACFAVGGGTPLATLTGIGISAADQFLLDKLLKGWRPNQFIDGPLKDFIEGDE